jgi:homocysteine S-methyltransferase
MTTFDELLAAPVVLAEGSIYERLRRHPDVEYDPAIAHAGLIYRDVDAERFADVHREYIAVAREAGLPMLVAAGTYRAGRERVARSAFADRPVNQDNVRFVRELCDAQRARGATLLVGGQLGPGGDAYRAEEGLPQHEARALHSYQADALAEGGADVLLAMTLPALPEARGMAQAMEATGLPYVLSFVVRDSGTMLDGTPLDAAIESIDQSAARAPTGYYVNCVHPTVLDAALRRCKPATVARIIGFRANTSSLRPEELDGSDELITEEPQVLAPQIADVWRRYGLTIVGGCCGTGTEHIAALAEHCRRPA